MKNIVLNGLLELFFILILVACAQPPPPATNEPQPPATTIPPTSAANTPSPSPTIMPSPEPTEIPFAPAIAVVGPEEIVFDWSFDACDPEDIPDLPARAFRDSDGMVNLLASHLTSRAKVGPTLDEVTQQCDIIMASDRDGDPSMFNDNEWIAAVYTEDGETVYAIIHNEYHGWDYDDCSTDTTNYGCWYNSLTLAVSYDGGKSFADAAPPPDNFVAGLPYPYEAEAGPYGIFEPSNILKAKDGYYYQVIRVDDYKSDEQWICLMRTDDLSDPGSWRAWDGEGFNMPFLNPYAQADADLSDYICATIGVPEIGVMQQSLTYNTYLDRYVLLGSTADTIDGREMWGIYYSFSEDLINWSRRQLLWERELPWTWEFGDENTILYPTLIDPDSLSLSFDTTDKQVYLYFTKFNFTSNLDRDLIRVPVEFFDTIAEARAADTRTNIDLVMGDISTSSVSVSGNLTTANGRSLADKTVNFYATQGEGGGEFYEYQLSGRIPLGATRAVLGYRVHIECDCATEVSAFALYEIRFEAGESGENLLPNPTFVAGLAGMTFWNGSELASIEPSDRGEGQMLQVVVDVGQTSAGDLANITVTGGEIYTATFAAVTPPSAQGTGFFLLTFLDDSGEMVRFPSYFAPPALPVGRAITDSNGAYEFVWNSPDNNSTLEAVFLGEEQFLPADMGAEIVLP